MEEKIKKLHDKARGLELTPGVYLMKDKSGEVIYVGKAKMLKNRVSSYFTNINAHTEKVYKMVTQVEDFDYIVTTGEFEALVLECSLIKQYKPKYNILLKDDKGYNYIKVEKPSLYRYPKISPCMKMGDDSCDYLGPFTSTYTVTSAVEQANKIFMLPTCGKSFENVGKKGYKPLRPCLNHYIKQCMGVCGGKVRHDVYMENFNSALSYLKKGSAELIESLSRDMESAAESLMFEKAAAIRDKINAIKKINQTQKVYMINAKDQDVICMASNSDISVITVINFRNSMLVDKQEFVFYDAFDQAALRGDFIANFYQNKSDIPNSVLIDEEIEDRKLIQDMLSKLAGKRVFVTVCSSSDHKKLMAIARKNAVDRLSKAVGRTTKELSALEELQQMLKLDKPPMYIESYDISNLGDSNIVGGMVVFENGRPLKSAYKRFMIKDVVVQDDYASMSEVITRRFNRYLNRDTDSDTDEGFARLPDLILLDGGKGHVNTISPILKQMGLSIPLFGMVKDSKHKTKAIAADKDEDGQNHEVSFSTLKSAFTLVTNIQDEVHRFSLAYQKQKRKSSAFELSLTKVKGIGQKKAVALIKHFKTQKELRQAEVKDLMSVAKINEETATRLHKFLQEQKV